MYTNPNRPFDGGNLREKPRHTDTGGSGSMFKDGYTREGRAPRTCHCSEPVSPERATRIEEAMSGGMVRPDYDDY